MENINGKEIAEEIKKRIKDRIENEYKQKDLKTPCLACILVGEDPASKTYVASKEKTCKELGILSKIERMSENSTFEEIKTVIENLNNNDEVSAILLQLPLPEKLRIYEDMLINTISPQKDVDSLTYTNLGKLFADKNEIAPCTAAGIIKLLKAYGILIEGKKATVVGRSLLVGKSVAMMLLKENATVQICTSKTLNLKEETRQADILITAIGKPKFFTKDMIKPGAVVIDVGINRIPFEKQNPETGLMETKSKLVGDVDYDNVKDSCSFITPVPGGVGPMTIAMLMDNTMTLNEKKSKSKEEEFEF